MRNILSHANPLTLSLAFLALALAFHAWSAGEWSTAWLMLLGYMGGMISGVLVTLMIAREE